MANETKKDENVKLNSYTLTIPGKPYVWPYAHTNPLQEPWKDRGTHYYLDAKYIADIHPTGLISGRRLCGAIGLSKTTKREDVIKDIKHNIRKPVSDASVARLGQTSEPLLWEWYKSQDCVKGLKLSIPGMASPKEAPHLCAIADVEVGEEGLAEFKTTEFLYAPLKDGKIFIDHYCQLQQELYCYKRKWIDYIVWGWRNSDVYRLRVYFDSKFWNDVAMPLLDEFISKHMSNTTQ